VCHTPSPDQGEDRDLESGRDPHVESFAEWDIAEPIDSLPPRYDAMISRNTTGSDPLVQEPKS